MSIAPSLSRLERQRLEEASHLAATGSPVRWRCVGRRMTYTVGRTECLIFTAGTDRVFRELCKQADEYLRNLEEVHVNERNSAA